jgi:ketosteroid isomerase-like protein
MSADGDRLADRDALRELRAKYSHFWDDGRAEDFVGLFTEDGVLQMATQGMVEGSEALQVAVTEAMRLDGFSINFTSDEVSEFTGEDTAIGYCRFAFQGGRTPNIEGAGTYHDEYRKTPQGWRFTKRTQSFFYMGPRDGDWPPTPRLG